MQYYQYKVFLNDSRILDYTYPSKDLNVIRIRMEELYGIGCVKEIHELGECC